MWEKEILAGIEKILDEDGKFLPDFDWARIRDQHPKLKRVKEGPFRRQVRELWQKNENRLKREKFYEDEYEGPGNNANAILQKSYSKNTPKS